VLVILAMKVFLHAATTEAFIEHTLRPASEWMDSKEKHYIAEFDTYWNGWNMTLGGQGRGWLSSIRHIKAKQNYLKFKDEYMPALRRYFKEHGHVNASKSHPVIGRLLTSIRCGNTSVPLAFEDELVSMGFDTKDQRRASNERRWVCTYMPMFREFYKHNGHVNVPAKYDVVGGVVTRIRSGEASVPASCLEEFISMGFDVRNQQIVERDRRWTDIYLPAFRQFYLQNGHINAPALHPVLGAIVDAIRCRRTAVPAQFEHEFLSMEFDFNNQRTVMRDTRWIKSYMPAFREFHKDNGHTNAPYSHPVLGILIQTIRKNGKIPEPFTDELLEMGFDMSNQSMKIREDRWDAYMELFRSFYRQHGHINVRQKHPTLGSLVLGIRVKGTFIPSEIRDELRHMGLFLCAKNLARHVVRALGRQVQSLDSDTEARAEVARAAVLHSALLTKRSTLYRVSQLKQASLLQVPFGLKPIGDGVARFHKDMSNL
jgi:hypothetical protein